jgi:hypothetical protein
MPGQLSNVTTADKYTDANTVAWPGTVELALQIANAAVLVQVDKSDQGIGEWGSDELFYGPAVGVLPLVCSGFRVRSALAGSPAQVTAQLFNNGETLGGGQLSPFTSIVSPSGGVTPPDVTVTLPHASGVLGGNVAMTNANVFYDGPLVNLGIGTWDVKGQFLVRANGVGALTGRLCDGAAGGGTTYAEGEFNQLAVNRLVEISLAATVTLAAPATLRLAAAGTDAGGSIRASTTDNQAPGTVASLINAVQIG